MLTRYYLQKCSSKTLERELPVFINLLKVTTETGLSLPQSVTCLSQSTDTSCPHLIDFFASISKHARAHNLSLSDALDDAGKEVKNKDVVALLKLLAMNATTQEGLFSTLEMHTQAINSSEEKKLQKLKGNKLRRCLPHICFFIFFAMPLTCGLMLGPALVTTQTRCLGPIVGEYR